MKSKVILILQATSIVISAVLQIYYMVRPGTKPMPRPRPGSRPRPRHIRRR